MQVLGVGLVREPVPDRCAHQAGTSPPPNTISQLSYLVLLVLVYSNDLDRLVLINTSPRRLRNHASD